MQVTNVVSISDPVALATLVVAAATVVLAFVTDRLAGLTRSTLDLSIRPLLADPVLVDGTEEMEHLLFGPPGRVEHKVHRGELYVEYTEERFSVAFENLGAGVATVTGASLDPGSPGAARLASRLPSERERISS